MVRARWIVVGIWVLILITSSVFAPHASSNLKAGWGSADVESRRGLSILQEHLDFSESALTVVFTSLGSGMTATDPEFVQEMESSLASLLQAPEVIRVITHYNSGNAHMVAPSENTAYALVLLDTSIDESLDRYHDIRQLISSDQLEILVTGGIAIFADLDRSIGRDLRRAEIIALPIVLIVLVLVFGSVIAAGLPVVIGVVSIVLTMALVFLLSQVIDVSMFVLNIATFLGLGIAIDYALLLVSRFREELGRYPKEEAVGITISTAGRTLVFSGITTVLGLSGLLLMDFMALKSIGIGGALVVGLSLLVALTLVPAMLGILGSRINDWSIVPIRPEREGVWRVIAESVMRHPLLVVIPVVCLLVVLGYPFLRVQIGAPWASILPAGAESRRGWELLSQEYGIGEVDPILLVGVSPRPILGDANSIGSLYDYVSILQTDPRISRIESIVTAGDEMNREEYQRIYSLAEGDLLHGSASGIQDLVRGNVTLLRIFEKSTPLSQESKALVRSIRASVPREHFQFYVTGATADIMDAVDVMYRDFPKVIAFVVITIYLALFWLFRSVVLPLKAIILNVMSIFASYGVLVYIFQEGHFEGLLGFTAQGHIEASIPILMFCLIFGLSMDYEVFLLSRVKEIYDTNKDNTRSVAFGLARTGRVITSAALILALVAASFATGEVVLVKALGVGLAVAVLIDASIVRVLLVPALMRILGDWNWWAPKLFRKSSDRAVH